MKTRTLARTVTVVCALASAPIVVGCRGPSSENATEAQKHGRASSPTAAGGSASQATTRLSKPGAGDPAWHYEGAEGPENWGMLSPKFAACADGRAQSPIDIGKTTSVPNVPALKTTFAPATLRIVHHEHMADSVNNGHTIQVNYSEGDTLAVGDASYQLAQYHFHAPSEHTTSGKHFPMEMHMVHKATDGKLAVIGVFIQEGQYNAAFEPVWSNLPREKGAETHLSGVKVDVDALLPRTRTTYRYDGSLTTPPCSEGVKWFVMTTPIELSASQIGQFTTIIKRNNRPVQPLNGRPVVSDAVAQTASRY